jgi:hypothetical protein
MLLKIAKRYGKCEVHIFPDCPELTPVEGVIRCAKEEGFVLVRAEAARASGAPSDADLKSALKDFVEWDEDHERLYSTNNPAVKRLIARAREVLSAAPPAGEGSRK